MKKILSKINTGVKTFLRRLFITLQFSGENSLPNHAAACAYGFLLSAAPLLLITSFFIFRAFQVSTNSIVSLVRNLPFMEIAIDEEWLTNNFYSIMLPGLSGITALISFLWAGRILAVALQRGLKIIFLGQKKRNPIFSTLVILAIELPALFLSLTIIFSSKTALLLYETFNFLPKNALFSFFISKRGYSFFSIIILWLITYFAYRVIPANPPRRASAFEGAVFCVILYEIMSMILKFMLGQSMYNILYGTLGNLIALLINVYFFFMFFLMGGQFAYVSDYFDSFLFIKMRQARLNKANNAKIFSASNLINRLFLPVEGRLRKYYRVHKKGETIFFQKDKSDLIYYILEGEVETLALTSPNNYTQTGTLGADSFFGEMGYLLSEDRSSTIRAKTDISALAFPPHVFEEILKHDSSLDRALLENLYRSLKDKNAQLASATSSPE